MHKFFFSFDIFVFLFTLDRIETSRNHLHPLISNWSKRFLHEMLIGCIDSMCAIANNEKAFCTFSLQSQWLWYFIKENQMFFNTFSTKWWRKLETFLSCSFTKNLHLNSFLNGLSRALKSVEFLIIRLQRIRFRPVLLSRKIKSIVSCSWICSITWSFMTENCIELGISLTQTNVYNAKNCFMQIIFSALALIKREERKSWCYSSRQAFHLRFDDIQNSVHIQFVIEFKAELNYSVLPPEVLLYFFPHFSLHNFDTTCVYAFTLYPQAEMHLLGWL